jgi:hypothetical protein
MSKRFTDKFKKREPDECWEWTGAKHPSGYGSIWFKGQSTGAHRVSWIIHKGPIPDNLFVCHHCDNPPCVNPKHLFLGTNQDNLKDAAKKNRLKYPKGTFASDETHQRSKLSNEQVRIIRSGKFRNNFLAKKFNVTHFTISRAKNRKTYKDVK